VHIDECLNILETLELAVKFPKVMFRPQKECSHNSRGRYIFGNDVALTSI
jgi:hypothetical protein